MVSGGVSDGKGYVLCMYRDDFKGVVGTISFEDMMHGKPLA